jgi:hypothetical protein
MELSCVRYELVTKTPETAGRSVEPADAAYIRSVARKRLQKPSSEQTNR